MIRLRRKKEAFRFRDEFRIVPRWLKVLCVILYLLAVAIGVIVIHVSPESRPSDLRDDVATATVAIVGIITAIGFLFSCFLLMLGYVNRDARRRGMNSALWTLLVLVLSPGSLFIGFIVYFLFREPMPYPCPRCNDVVSRLFKFYSIDNCDLPPSCPNCKREIAETDKFCPYCAQDLVSKGEIGKSLAEEHS